MDLNTRNNGTKINDIHQEEDPSQKYGALDTTNLNTGFWMAKIPPKLASVWKEAEEGTVLGTLTFTKGGGVLNAKNTSIRTTGLKPPPKHSLTVSVSPALTNNNPDLPPLYKIENLTKKLPGVLYPFTRENNQNASVALKGVVSQSCHFQISRENGSSFTRNNLSSMRNNKSSSSGSEYRRLCQDRLIKNNNLKRTVKPVDASVMSSRRTAAIMSAGRGFGAAVQEHGKSLLDAKENAILQGKKRKFAAVEGGESARSVIFQLFSTKRYWTIKDLRIASGSPEKEIRPILNEIGVFIRNGENR